MNSTSVIQMLKTLSKDELIEFEKLIISPYFNRKSKVTELFFKLKKFHPEFSAADIKREKIFEQIYPGKSFNYGVLKNLFHELNKLGETFLKIKGFDEDKIEQKLYLAKELLKRELYTAGDKNLKSIGKMLGKETDMSGQYFLRRYNYETAGYYQEYFRSGDKDFSKKRINENFINRESCIRHYYLITLSDLLGEITAENMIYKEKTPLDVSEKVIAFFNENVSSSSPALRLRAHKLMLELSSDNTDQYIKCRTLIYEYEDFLRGSKEFAYNYFMTVLNFINYRILEGMDEYYNDLFEIYNKLVEYDILSVLNNIPLVLFREILKVSVKMEEYEFASKFFSDFKERIETESLESEFKRYKSQEHFQKKDFKKSLEYLSGVKFGDVNIKWSIHLLTIKNYLELKRFADMSEAINAARQFLRYNRKLMEKSYESRENFLKVMEKILRLSELPEKTDAEYLINELGKSSFVDKNWCSLKIKEIAGIK